MKTFLLFFALQFLSYLNLTLSIRALAHEQWQIAVLCQSLQPLLVWFIMERVAEAHHEWAGRIGVMAGGALATAVTMWLTRGW